MFIYLKLFYLPWGDLPLYLAQQNPQQSKYLENMTNPEAPVLSSNLDIHRGGGRCLCPHHLRPKTRPTRPVKISLEGKNLPATGTEDFMMQFFYHVFPHAVALASYLPSLRPITDVSNRLNCCRSAASRAYPWPGKYRDICSTFNLRDSFWTICSPSTAPKVPP